jgi:hypothetical protein
MAGDISEEHTASIFRVEVKMKEVISLEYSNAVAQLVEAQSYK